MNEFRFKSSVFQSLCNYAKAGKLREIEEIFDTISNEERQRFTKDTLCPDPKLHLGSPFVLAAQHGQLHVLQYLMTTFPGLIDINRGASIVSKQQKIETHNVPPLVAACTISKLEVVKYLIKNGADVKKCSLTGANPVRAAAYYGYIDIVEYLLENGADIDKPNCIGSSPLLAAAHNGGHEITRYLIERGANWDQRTIEGYTAIHEAAHKGDTPVCKVLLELGMSPFFAPSHPMSKDYVPCPLFLAASVGNQEVFDLLLNHPACPAECKPDAHLLMASSLLQYSNDLDSFNLWSKGLELMEQLNPPLPVLPPRPQYSNLKEIRSKAELESLWDNYDQRSIEVSMQCLIIRERCLGTLDQSLVDCIIKEAMSLLYNGHYNECERLLAHAMFIEDHICSVECNHPEYGYCDGIMKDLMNDLSDFVFSVELMLSHDHVPNFNQVFKFGLTTLSHFDRLRRTKADGEVIEFDQTIKSIMKLLSMWLSCDHHTHQVLKPQHPSVAACRELVQCCSIYPTSHNLLLLLMKLLPRLSIATRPLILDTLLSCGADVFVNDHSPDGSTVLSYLVDLGDATFTSCSSILLSHGLHLDMVDSEGQLYLNYPNIRDKCTTFLCSKDPHRLQCLVSHAIVKMNINYTGIGLPSRVVSWVKLHDAKFVPIIRTPVDKYFYNN